MFIYVSTQFDNPLPVYPHTVMDDGRDLVMMEPPLEEDLMDNEHEQTHLLDAPAPETSTASVPPARQSISSYLFLLATVMLFGFWCRSRVPTMVKRVQSNLVRWMEQIMLNCKTMTRDDWVNFLEIFFARLVLEVLGAAGAIWGFSEAVGFRTSLTVWFWRPASLFTGAVFFFRWLLQIRDFMKDHRHEMSSNNMYKEINMVEARNGNHETANDEQDADDSELLLKFPYGKARRRGSYGATSSCERIVKGKRHSLA